MDRQRLTLPIEDFGCAGSGALLLERALGRVPGVLRVYVNAETEMAYVQFDADRCTLADLTHAIEQVGFRTNTPLLP